MKIFILEITFTDYTHKTVKVNAPYTDTAITWVKTMYKNIKSINVINIQ